MENKKYIAVVESTFTTEISDPYNTKEEAEEVLAQMVEDIFDTYFEGDEDDVDFFYQEIWDVSYIIDSDDPQYNSYINKYL